MCMTGTMEEAKKDDQYRLVRLPDCKRCQPFHVVCLVGSWTMGVTSKKECSSCNSKRYELQVAVAGYNCSTVRANRPESFDADIGLDAVSRFSPTRMLALQDRAEQVSSDPDEEADLQRALLRSHNVVQM